MCRALVCLARLSQVATRSKSNEVKHSKAEAEAEAGSTYESWLAQADGCSGTGRYSGESEGTRIGQGELRVVEAA